MREMWDHPLGRHIIVVLIIKLAAIYAIWWFFFRPLVHTEPMGTGQVSAAIVGSPATGRVSGNNQSSSAIKE